MSATAEDSHSQDSGDQKNDLLPTLTDKVTTPWDDSDPVYQKDLTASCLLIVHYAGLLMQAFSLSQACTVLQCSIMDDLRFLWEQAVFKPL